MGFLVQVVEALIPVTLSLSDINFALTMGLGVQIDTDAIEFHLMKMEMTLHNRNGG